MISDCGGDEMHVRIRRLLPSLPFPFPSHAFAKGDVQLFWGSHIGFAWKDFGSGLFAYWSAA